MNKTLISLIVMIMIALTPTVLAAESPQLAVTMVSYSPVPAEPGSYVTVTFKVENTGTANAPNAAIEFVDNYPFSVDNTKLENLGRIGAGEESLVEYRVRIDSAALQGTNYLKVRHIADQSSNNWLEKEIALTVNSNQQTVSINSVIVEPKNIAPGEEAQVDVMVKNLASSDLRDVSVKLNLAGTLVGTEYIDLPFAPIGSSVEKKISLLKSGQTADYVFTLQAYPEATGGIYKIPVTLTYTDKAGTEYTTNDLISLVVNSKPDIMVTLDENMVYSDNGVGEVTLSITNKGFDEIKFLTVSLAESKDYKIHSTSNQIYIGNVDSDDYETVSFEVDANQGVSKLELPVTLSFKDALNKQYNMEETIIIDLPTTKQAGKGSSSTGIIIAVVVVVLIIGIILVRKNKHKKK